MECELVYKALPALQVPAYRPMKERGAEFCARLERAGFMLDAGELPADLIVWATGCGSMNGWIVRLIDQPTADKVGKLWMQGGNLHQNRHFSLSVALQLKARMKGIPTPVYGLAPVHHLR